MRCKRIHDAEDLSQEIVTRAFRALLIKDDVRDVGRFIWAIAHNTLSNYYRDIAKSMVGVSIDEVAEMIADPNSPRMSSSGLHCPRTSATVCAIRQRW